MNNLKQIGLGLVQYTQDYDEKLPMQYYPGSGTVADFAAPTAPQNWLTELYPYTKSWQIYRCPSAKTYTPPATYNAESNTSYFGNAVALLRFLSPLSIAQIDDPAGLIVIHENDRGDGSSYLRPTWSVGTPTNTPYFLWVTATYDITHFDGANVLFADGHVKWRKQSSLCATDFGLNAPSGANNCGVTTPTTATTTARF